MRAQASRGRLRAGVLTQRVVAQPQEAGLVDRPVGTAPPHRLVGADAALQRSQMRKLDASMRDASVKPAVRSRLRSIPRSWSGSTTEAGVVSRMRVARVAYGPHMTSANPHRVLIAGGGVGGLEAMLALRDLAGDRVSLTLLTPDDAFVVRALSVRGSVRGPGAAALRPRADVRRGGRRARARRARVRRPAGARGDDGGRRHDVLRRAHRGGRRAPSPGVRERYPVPRPGGGRGGARPDPGRRDRRRAEHRVRRPVRRDVASADLRAGAAHRRARVRHGRRRRVQPRDAGGAAARHLRRAGERGRGRAAATTPASRCTRRPTSATSTTAPCSAWTASPSCGPSGS